MKSGSTTLFAGLALLLGAAAIPSGSAQQTSVPPSAPIKAKQLTGITGVKNNTKGELSVENAQLHFKHGKETADLSATSMEEVMTGADSQRAIGGTIGWISMVAPYGSGRFLSLFRTKIDTLTIRYRDADGALHGAIFTMPVGAAEGLKKGLVAQGAHSSAPVEQNAPAASPGNPPSTEKK